MLIHLFLYLSDGDGTATVRIYFIEEVSDLFFWQIWVYVLQESVEFFEGKLLALLVQSENGE